MKKFTLLFCLTTFFSLAQTISITPFATGLSSVVGIFHAGDSRLFVVQQTGAIRIVQPNGTVDPTNFLTLTTATISTGGERGLLGLAFHPDYDTNGYFYVNYTRAGDGATVIARYTRSSSNPNIADPSTAAVLLTVAQPFSNHNGGTIAFGPDGYLYIGMGDGGSAGDPGNRAQNINENLGKMLRIDVDSGAPYAIPADNPYVGIPGNDEIWAIGLRNPWKWSFDRLTGDLYIADVGQGEYEEINRVSSTDPGVNYGWKCYEGSDVYSACTGTGVTFTFPVAEYSHSGTGGCSITGGYVYRGTTYPNFVGKYFFADYCLPRIGMMDETNNLTYSANFTGVPNFTTFGEDVTGELYVGGDDTIYKITDASLGTNQNLKNGFALYPNPANAEVFIRSASANTLTEATILDITGKKLLVQKLGNPEVNSINISQLQNGTYLISVEDVTGAKFSSKLTVK